MSDKGTKCLYPFTQGGVHLLIFKFVFEGGAFGRWLSRESTVLKDKMVPSWEIKRQSVSLLLCEVHWEGGSLRIREPVLSRHGICRCLDLRLLNLLNGGKFICKPEIYGISVGAETDKDLFFHFLSYLFYLFICCFPGEFSQLSPIMSVELFLLSYFFIFSSSFCFFNVL